MVTWALGVLKQGICGLVFKKLVLIGLPIVNNNNKFWEEQIAYFYVHFAIIRTAEKTPRLTVRIFSPRGNGIYRDIA
jgi:hypothetical protein